jgi:hypothetical protein
VPAPRPGGSGDRFGLLLLALIVSYLVSAFLTGAWVSVIQIVLFVTVAALAVRTGQIRRRTAHLALGILTVGSVAAAVLTVTHHADAAGGLASLWTAAVLLFAVVLILRRVLGHPVITLQSIYGAISAYVILGLMFAAFYGALHRFTGGGFFAAGQQADIKTFQYFSFTTLTTLGYGDFTAAGSGGRAVAMIEALTGQVFLATLVARLVAAFRAPSRAQPRGRRRRGLGAGGRRRSPVRRQPPGSVRRTSSRARGKPARR